MDQCKVSVTIPFDPMEPWLGSVIGKEPDTGVELMAHITLTSLCEDLLTATAALPITLLEAVSNLKGPHIHAGMTLLAKYMQYLFNFQHNTIRTGMQQCTHLAAYKKSATVATYEMERLRHENAILCSSARPPSEQEREL
jgi:hypothetical protein